MKKLMVVPALLKAHIESYTRKDGTYVAAHDDQRQAAAPKSGKSSMEGSENTFINGLHKEHAASKHKQHVNYLKGLDFEHIGKHKNTDYFRHPQTGEVRSVSTYTKAPNPVERHSGKTGTSKVVHKHEPNGVPDLVKKDWEKD
jgi:hypothetical protein